MEGFFFGRVGGDRRLNRLNNGEENELQAGTVAPPQRTIHTCPTETEYTHTHPAVLILGPQIAKCCPPPHPTPNAVKKKEVEVECCKLSRGQLADQGAISESSTKGACAVVCVRVFKRLPALRVRRGCASVGVAQLSEFIALSGVWPRPTLHKLIPILTAYFSIRSLAVL